MTETSRSPRQLLSTRRLRVAFCIDSFSIGGTELNAVRTAEAFDYSRIELSVYHLQTHGPLRERYEKLGVRMTHIPIPNLYSWRTMAQGVALARMLRQERIDIVHSHDIYTNIFAAPWVRLLTPCKLIASRRWWYEAPRPELVPLNRISYRFSHRVLANSRGVADLLAQEERVSRDKITEIPNFLSDTAFAMPEMEEIRMQRVAWGVPDTSFLIGIIARLSPVKNHALLLQAMAMLPLHCHLAVIGSGPERDRLVQLSRHLEIEDRVHFVGEVLSNSNYHHFFDCSVLCSTSEGFPNSLIEAMAAARPVVSTPVGGVTDVVEHGVTGLLAPLDQPESLADQILDIIKNPKRAEAMGIAGQKFVQSHFSQDQVIERLHTLYEQLVIRPRGAQP